MGSRAAEEEHRTQATSSPVPTRYAPHPEHEAGRFHPSTPYPGLCALYSVVLVSAGHEGSLWRLFLLPARPQERGNWKLEIPRPSGRARVWYLVCVCRVPRIAPAAAPPPQPFSPPSYSVPGSAGLFIHSRPDAVRQRLVSLSSYPLLSPLLPLSLPFSSSLLSPSTSSPIPTPISTPIPPTLPLSCSFAMREYHGFSYP